jgi:NAD(P)-binding Rossmann-like domain
MMSFCRLDDKPIRTHVPFAEPDALIIQDPMLLHQADRFAGLGREGYMLINSTNSLDELGLDDSVSGFRFPAIMGRVCYRPCGTACNRAQLDSAVAFNSVERFLGDEALRRGWKVPVDAAPTGKRVPVVGAGPSGLSAAYHLTRLGHSVTVKDAGVAFGGMMRYGIPKYRLPGDIMDAEVNRIPDMSVTLEPNAKVTDILGKLNRPPAATLGREAASTPPSWPSAPTSAAAPTSRPGTRPGSRTRCRCCTASTSRPRCSRRAAECPAGTASAATTGTASAPATPSSGSPAVST